METTLEFLPELRKIKEFLHTQQVLKGTLGFPYEHFEAGAVLVSRLITDPEERRILEPVFGYAMMGSKIPHAWNYHKESQMYFDIAFDRFGQNSINDILPIKVGEGIYRPDLDGELAESVKKYMLKHERDINLLEELYQRKLVRPSRIA
jgi:hypothetical protein